MIDIRKKAVLDGFFSLDEKELLALILETGSSEENVEAVSKKLLDKYGSLENIIIEKEGKVEMKGVGFVKRIRLLSSLEIFRRFSLLSIDSIHDDKECFLLTKSFFYKRKRECLLIFVLDENKNVIKIFRCDSKGSNRITIDIDQLNQVLKYRYSGLILVHNHPSGCTLPSEDDIASFKKISKICSLYSIKIIDFMIVSDKKWYSMFNKKEK